MSNTQLISQSQIKFDENNQALSENAYIEKTLDTYRFLKNETDLSPRNPKLNSVLSSFVRATMMPRPQEETDNILSDKRIKDITNDLRHLLGRAECEMEHLCADAMVGRSNFKDKGYASFEDFIYMDNYKALVDIELKALGWPKKTPPINAATQSIAFVGAGPLPISAILLHLYTGLPVTCVDSDEESCIRGSRLLRYLAKSDPKFSTLGTKMGYAHVNGAAHDYVTHPIVFIASLVDNKNALIPRILDTANTTTTVVIRSAEGLGSLLYEPYQLSEAQDMYIYNKRKTELCPEAINVSHVLSYPSGKVRTRNKIDDLPENHDVTAITLKKRQLWRSQATKLTI